MTVEAQKYFMKAAKLAREWWGPKSTLTTSFTQNLERFTRRTKQGLAALPPAARLHALKVPVSAVAAVEPWLPQDRTNRTQSALGNRTASFWRGSTLSATHSTFSRPSTSCSTAGSGSDEEPSWRLEDDPSRLEKLETVAGVVGLPDEAMDELERAWTKRDVLAARSHERAQHQTEQTMAAYRELLPYL